MKLKREYLVGLLVIIFAGLYFFTPIGFHAKIYLNRLVSHNPTPVAEREQQFLEDYHWELEDAVGDPFNLETYKGKVILMNFWASWCPPLRGRNARVPAIVQRLWGAGGFFVYSQGQER